MQISEELRHEAGAMRVRYLRGLLQSRKHMSPTTQAGQETRLERIASRARRRGQVPKALRTAMTGAAGLVSMVLLFLVIAAFFVFGSRHESASTPELRTSLATAWATPAGANDAPLRTQVSSGNAADSEYFSSAYPNRGRDGEGNVMTYEHD
jgi:hypothetical protein